MRQGEQVVVGAHPEHGHLPVAGLERVAGLEHGLVVRVPDVLVQVLVQVSPVEAVLRQVVVFGRHVRKEFHAQIFGQALGERTFSGADVACGFGLIGTV